MNFKMTEDLQNLSNLLCTGKSKVLLQKLGESEIKCTLGMMPTRFSFPSFSPDSFANGAKLLIWLNVVCVRCDVSCVSS